jgi:hypothetical protein
MSKFSKADNIKMDVEEVGGARGDWMELAQNRDRWWALVSTVKTFGFHKMRGISWLAAKTGQLLKKDSAAWRNLIMFHWCQADKSGNEL